MVSRVGALDGEQVEEVGRSLERSKGAYLQKPVQAQLAFGTGTRAGARGAAETHHK
jgi:hypothetical protein